MDRLPDALAALEALRLPPPLIGGRDPFERARDAMPALQGGTTVGNLVLVIE